MFLLSDLNLCIMTFLLTRLSTKWTRRQTILNHIYRAYHANIFTEQQVGITEFVDQQPPFSCVFKHRVEDFVVHEIDPKGRIVRLQNCDEPNDVIFSRKSGLATSDLNYVHFVAYKANVETTQLLHQLSFHIKNGKHSFNIAGAKDKKAATTQMMSAYRISPNALRKYAKNFNERSNGCTRILFGHFKLSANKITLGELSGNHFEIVLRDVQPQPGQNETQLKATVGETLGTIKNVGCINYYGMQRLKTNPKRGVLVLKGHFKQLVNEILVERHANERASDIAFNEAIRVWQKTGDAELALKKLPHKQTIEGALLRGLRDMKTADYYKTLCSALEGPDRHWYLNTYQSYVWNRIASLRYQEYGTEVVEGDLVYVGPNSNVNAENEEEAKEEIRCKADGTIAVRAKSRIPPQHIALVTTENRSQFSIYDVVLPVIGSGIKLPQNRMRDAILSILAEDGVTMEHFDHLPVPWFLNGSYRRLLVRPTAVKWSWHRYIDDRPLILTDYDRIRGLTIEESDPNDPNGRTALKIEFSLPTSTYATMIIRELTKHNTAHLENIDWKQQHSEQKPVVKLTTTRQSLTANVMPTLTLTCPRS